MLLWSSQRYKKVQVQKASGLKQIDLGLQQLSWHEMLPFCCSFLNPLQENFDPNIQQNKLHNAHIAIFTKANRQAPQGNEVGVNVNSQGQPRIPTQPGHPSQSVPQGIQIPLGAGIAIPTLATVVIQ